MKNERILYKTNRKSIYIWAILLFVIAFSVIACTNFISNAKIANAESPYEGQYVNFNQMFDFNNTVGNPNITKANYYYVINGNFTSQSWWVIGNSSGYVNGHIYFLKIKQDGNLCRLVIDNSNLRGYSSAIITLSGYSNNAHYYIVGDTGNYSNYKFQLYIIDLTLMFGSNDNLPTLEQCENLFPADYYQYNQGTPELYYGNAGAGSLALTKTIDFVLTSGNLAKSDLYGTYISLNTNNGDTQLFTDVNYNVESQANAQVIYRFNTTIPAGAKITISVDRYYCLHDFYLLNDNSGDHLGIITHQDSYADSFKQFFLQNDMSQLSINFWSNGSTGTPAITWSKFTITAEYVTNMSILLQDAYNNGVSETKEFYTEGNLGYEQIFNQGVASVGGDAYNIFPDSWTFIGNAFSSVGDMLSMEIFPKVPLGLFVALPLLLGLIMFIVRIAKGGS